MPPRPISELSDEELMALAKPAMRPISELSDEELMALARPAMAITAPDGPATTTYNAKVGGPMPALDYSVFPNARQFAANSVRLAGPVVGAVLGTPADVVTGPGGTLAGAAGGAYIGSQLGDLIEGRDTLTAESQRRALGTAAAAPLMVGLPMNVSPAVRPMVNLARQAAFGGAVGASTAVATDLAAEGKTSAGNVALGGSIGLLLGLLGGNMQNTAIRGQAFDLARSMGFKGETVGELKNWAKEQTIARAKPVGEPTTEPAPVVEPPKQLEAAAVDPASPVDAPAPAGSGDELLARAQAAGIEAPAARPPISTLTDAQLLENDKLLADPAAPAQPVDAAAAAQAEPANLQAPTSGAGSAPNIDSGGETASAPALDPNTKTQFGSLPEFQARLSQEIGLQKGPRAKPTEWMKAVGYRPEDKDMGFSRWQELAQEAAALPPGPSALKGPTDPQIEAGSAGGSGQPVAGSGGASLVPGQGEPIPAPPTRNPFYSFAGRRQMVPADAPAPAHLVTAEQWAELAPIKANKPDAYKKAWERALNDNKRLAKMEAANLAGKDMAKPLGSRVGTFAPRSDGVKDLIEAVQATGGVPRPAPGSSGFDEFTSYFRGRLKGLIHKTKTGHWDSYMKDTLAAEHPEFAHVADWQLSELGAQLEADLAHRDRLKVADGILEQQSKFFPAAMQGEGRAAKSMGNPLPTDGLRAGDTLKVKGQDLKVLGINADDGSVTVQDGPRYGTQILPAGSSIIPDKRSFKAAQEEKTTGPFEDSTPYVTAHSRYKQLRALESTGQLDAAGHAELDRVEKGLGQDFFDHYEATTGLGGQSEAETAAMRKAQLKTGSEARLHGGELSSQIDLLGPTTDKEGQFALFEKAANNYLDARQISNPVTREAVRGILAGVAERRMARNLHDQQRSDERLASELRSIAGGNHDTSEPAGLAGSGHSESRSPGQIANDRDLRSSAILRRRGQLYTDRFQESGHNQLVGKTFTDQRDFIGAAQILRSREVENYYVFLVKRDSHGSGFSTLSVVALSSRMPGQVSIDDFPGLVRELKANINALGADGLIELHNHPSGVAKPSSEDVTASAIMRKEFGSAYIGHLVINHGTYAWINKDRHLSMREVPAVIARPDSSTQSQGDTSYLGRRLSSQNDLISLAYDVHGAQEQILVFMANTKGLVTGVYAFTPEDLTKPDLIRMAARMSQGLRGFAYYDGRNPLVDKQLGTLANAGYFRDVAIARDGSVSLIQGAEAKKGWFGQTATPAHRLAEEADDYDLADDAPLHAIDTDSGEVMPITLAQLDKVPVVEMPELVQIVKQLSGEIPSVKNLRPSRGGHMSPVGRGRVVLNRRFFNDPVFMAQVLAHELGHLNDYLPNHSLKRGNLIGRLATLQSYLKNEFAPAMATNKELRAELKALDHWWTPWDEATAKDWYKAYRNSAIELYAQATSVLFNNPAELKARAPNFWNEFFRFIDRKPEVKAELFATWDLIHRGATAVSAERLKGIRSGFAKGEEILLNKAAERAARRNNIQNSLDDWKQKHFDLYAPIIDKARVAKAAGAVLPWHHDPEYVFDAHPLGENDNYRFLNRVDKNVLTPLAAVGLEHGTLGEYLFFNRIMHEAYATKDGLTGGRTTVANPLGHTPATARRELLQMRYRLGPARMDALKAAARQFQDLVFEVVERGHKAGIYSKANYDLAAGNRYNYATFAVVDYLEASPHIPAGIKHQRGTLKDVANPFTISVLKMLTANKLSEHNQAKRVAVQLLTDHFSDEIAQAAVTKIPLANGKLMYRNKPAPLGKKELLVLTNGRPVMWHVDPDIARMFEHRMPASSHAIVGMMNWTFRNMFYPTFLTYNPAFQLWMNPTRDLRRSYVNLPSGAKRRHFIGEQIKTNVTGRERIHNDLQQADLTRRRSLVHLRKQRPLTAPEARELRALDLRAFALELMATRALSTPFESFAHNPGGNDIWGKMLQQYKLMPEEGQGTFIREHVLGKAGLGTLADRLDAAGMILEAMPKAGAYRVMTRELGWKAHEAAQYVRNHVGTPNHLRRGTWAALDGTLFPFINIFIQGLTGDVKQARGQALGPVDPRKQRFEWWRRMAEGTLVPRLLQALAAAGVLGAGLKKAYDGVSEYNKTNYLVLPLGTTAGGENGYKSVVLRLPEDETARVLGGLLHHTIQAAFNDDPLAKSSLTDLVNVMGGNLPGVNPLVSLADGWRYYAAGVNPRDGLRDNTVMSSTQFNAGGWTSLKGMFGWSWEQTGGANFVRWDKNANTTAEMIMGAIPLLNRALIITDAGLREKQEQASITFDQQNAKIRASVPENVNKLLGEYNRLMSIRPEVRSMEQVYRLKELSLWNSKIWTPNYRTMQELPAKDWQPLGQSVGEMSKAFDRK